MKFAISVLIIGGSAFILGYGFQIWPGGAKLSPWWFLAVVFIIQTVAELFLSPVGLSTTSALAPKNFASQTMSLWLQDGEHRELRLLLRPGGRDGRRGHHPVHRRPVDGAEDGRRRGHRAGLGAVETPGVRRFRAPTCLLTSETGGCHDV